MPRLAYLRQPTPADARCAAGNRETRNARNPTAQRQTETAPAQKNRRDPKDRNGIREPAVRAMQRFPHTRPIAPPRSGSTRPGPEVRFYSLAPYFGLPDIRHNEARSALSERSDVRQGDIRTGPDHRTNYPNIAGRNAEGRGGLPARRIRQRTPLPHRQTPAKDLPLQSAPEPARPPKSTRLPACNPELRNPSSFLLPLYPPSVSKLGRTQTRSKNTFAAAVPELSPDSQNLNRFRAALLVRPCKRFRPTAGSSSGPADRTSPGT